MSADLPDFSRGSELSAAALQALSDRIGELQARHARASTPAQRPRRLIPARRFAFQLCELGGVLYHRQGLLDLGNGEYLPVGSAEWNAVGSAANPCTVWLEITLPDPAASQGEPDGSEQDASPTAAVVAGPYDISTPETNLRRRLGYIRAESRVVGDGEERMCYYLVQVLGGLICPYAPRRLMSQGGKSDSGSLGHAGFLSGTGYTVGENRHYRNHITLKWRHSVLTYPMDAAHGGEQFFQYMAFSNAFA